MPPKKEAKKEVQEVPKEVEPEIPLHQLQGYGRFEYINGATYQGNWRLVKGVKTKHGQGILTIPGSTSNQLGKEFYEGNWEQDAMHGFGAYHYADGSIYSGEWKQNKHNGRGQYSFSNGTIYEGQWLNHELHGSGFFIDHNGRKWEGQFRNGKFESRRQRQLVKEKAIAVRKLAIRKQVENSIGLMVEAISKSDKKNLKDNFGPFFPIGETIKQQVKEPYPKLEQRPPQKWTQFLNFLKTTGEYKILNNQAESTFIPADRIIARQLSGAGQIVEISNIKEQRSARLSLVNVEGSNWIIVFASDEEKKK